MITNEIYTGAVRRIDDLNRVIIPKDICIKANIKSGGNHWQRAPGLGW